MTKKRKKKEKRLIWLLTFHQKSWRAERRMFFQVLKGKNCHPVNSISSENTLDKQRWNEDILRRRKIKRKLVASRFTLKSAKESSSNRREMVLEGNLEHQEWRKATEVVNIWVNIIHYSLNFYKVRMTVKSKNSNNVFWDFQCYLWCY